jgi:hypothetical protein
MTNTSSQEQKNLPSDESLGELEPVAHFYGAMPTGVTVSTLLYLYLYNL